MCHGRLVSKVSSGRVRVESKSPESDARFWNESRPAVAHGRRPRGSEGGFHVDGDVRFFLTSTATFLDDVKEWSGSSFDTHQLIRHHVKF